MINNNNSNNNNKKKKSLLEPIHKTQKLLNHLDKNGVGHNLIFLQEKDFAYIQASGKIFCHPFLYKFLLGSGPMK